jgi:hypothetical protein
MRAAPAEARPATRRAAPLRAAAMLVAAALAAAALLALAMRSPAPARVDVGAPGDAYDVAGFYRAEGEPGDNFRWSAPGSSLLVPAAYDGPLALELRLRAPPFADPAAPPVRLMRDGAAVAELRPGPESRVYRMLLPPDAAPEPAPLRQEPLGLVAPPAYGQGDPRPLGVALDGFALRALPGATPWAPVLARAAAIAAGLALAMALLLPKAVGREAWGVSGAGAGLLVLAGAALALWAWRDPLGFAWAVPTPGPIHLAAGVGLAALVGWGGRAVAAGLSRPRLAALAALAVGAALLLLGGPPAGLGALVVMLLPGALAARALFPDEDDLATVVFLGICGAIAVAALLMLAVHALPGAPPAWLPAALSIGIAAAILAPTPPLPHSPTPPLPHSPTPPLPTLALLAALALRLWQLGGAEFQGDEARAMLLAAAVARGEDTALLTHTKGPVEALLPAASLTIAGLAPEWVARLPFALASLGVLAGVAALLRAFARWQAARGARPLDAGLAALVAVALLAVDGFAIAFARIVQYQSMVMLAMAGALWCCWRFYAGAEGARRHLVAAAVLVAVGLLAHYDAVMVVPALGWLVVAGGLRRGWRAREWAQQLAAPVLVGAALLASFFAPYILGPSFAGTAEYLAGRAGQGDAGGPPFNNLPLYLDILAFYNAPPLVPILAALVIAAVAALLVRHVRPRPLGAALAAALGAAALAQWLAPALYTLPGGASWAGLAFGLPLLGLCAAPGVPAHVRAVALWFATALCAEAFVIAEPRTHFYTAHIPAALLAGLAAAGPWPRLRTLAPRAVAVVAVAALAGGGLYAQLVYLRQLPEYQRVFPAARPDLLRARYGDALPEAGYFGFPHRDGWKAVAELYRRGELRGSYDTNQNRWLAGWYLRGLAEQCKGAPDLYLIAEAEPTVYYPPGYTLFAEIFVGPARALAIYSRTPPADGPRAYRLEALAAAFDSHPISAAPTLPLLTRGAQDCGP